MEIVIKIPDDVYTRLFDNGIQDNEIAVDDICEMARAIRLGTPLEAQPCEDCISRSELLRHQHIIYDDDGEGYKAVYVKDIKAMPPVTPQRPKGEWIEYEVDVAPHPLHCSLCGFSNHHISNRYMREFRRCPNCGAEMEDREE